jgi:hypothetical protein
MRPTLRQVSAGAALLGTGVIVGAAVPAGGGQPRVTAAAPAPVEVRTQVIHRTVRIVRHERRKAPRHVAAPAAATAPAVAAAAPRVVTPAPAATAPARPLVTRSSATGSSHAAPPLRTRASATGGAHEHEHEDGEHEGGGDD